MPDRATDDRLWAAYRRGWDSLNGKPGANDDARHMVALHTVAAEVRDEAAALIDDQIVSLAAESSRRRAEEGNDIFGGGGVFHLRRAATAIRQIGPQPIHSESGDDK